VVGLVCASSRFQEKKVTSIEFKRCFQNKHLTKQYYDIKMKEFFKLKLGSMTIDENKRRFLESLKYVPFIKDEQVNIQRYLSGFPLFIDDKIRYNDPNTLEETIRCAKCLCEHQRGRSNFQRAWEDKMKSKLEQRKKGAKPSFSIYILQGQTTLQDPRMSDGKKFMAATYVVLGLWRK
jgi:hypothetical protein